MFQFIKLPLNKGVVIGINSCGYKRPSMVHGNSQHFEMLCRLFGEEMQPKKRVFELWNQFLRNVHAS